MIARAVIDGAALPPTRTRYAVLLFVYFAAFITYLDRVCISVAAPAMQRDLGLSEIQFAWVFTAFYIAYSMFELDTAAKYKIPVVTIVYNNNSWGMWPSAVGTPRSMHFYLFQENLCLHF